MDFKQENITLWSNSGDICEMRISSNITRLNMNMNLYSTALGLVYNHEPQCTWTVHFMLTKPKLPPKLFEEFSFEILLTRRFLQDYGIMDMGKFYNNLDFDGGQIEEANAKEFADKCAKAGMVFLDDKALSAPVLFDKDVKSPKLFTGTEKAGSLPEEWANLDPFRISNVKEYTGDKMTQTEDSDVKSAKKELRKSI